MNLYAKVINFIIPDIDPNVYYPILEYELEYSVIYTEVGTFVYRNKDLHILHESKL